MQKLQTNLLTLTDSYKVSHYRQYPPGTQYVESYFESRGGDFDSTVFFGLQYLLMSYLVGQAFTERDIDKAKPRMAKHFGDDKLFNEAGWRRLFEKYQGMLPVSIKAVPEGTPVRTGNILMKIRNSDPEFPWLTNYLETLLVQTWYPSTVASKSRAMKQLIKRYLDMTADNADGLNFKLHDFGFRGVSSVESAAWGGAAHLVNFFGTDTMVAMDLVEQYYEDDNVGFSIPAAEHSTITSWGRENEAKAYKNMLDQFPTGLVAVVSDSYDIYNAVTNIWGTELKGQVETREGLLVIRPDSGYPPLVVRQVIELLMQKFGFTTTKNGYKLLPPYLRVIQGDGISDVAATEKILVELQQNGISTDNVAFGMGGGLLQQVNRDTSKYAFKCSSINVDGDERDVFKQPITDTGKRSKAGILKLVKDKHGFHTEREGDSILENHLVEVFRDGQMLSGSNFQQIRERAKV